jgi:glycosyltransferase involved in cell wall biosynthesis
MPGDVDVVRLALGRNSQAVIEVMFGGSAPVVLVHRPGLGVSEAALARLVAALTAPMAATASPVPVAGGSADGLGTAPITPALPPPPSLASPCEAAFVVSRAALNSLGSPGPGDYWDKSLPALWQRLVAAGWRHVAAPGVTWPWDPQDEPVGGPANEGLRTHRLWADSRRRGELVVVDGACLTDDPHNGSQAVVWNVVRALKRTRPRATVNLAVPERHLAHLTELASGSGVEVIARGTAARGFDVVYRPYQPLDPGELTWMMGAGERVLTSQLDVIAFSNPAYHPSPALFHAVRNLQRHAMRMADGVTFISEFGRQAALAECPDLEESRTFVVSCGADIEPPTERQPSGDVATRVRGPFVACLSATFWHKNRQHAIRVFQEMCLQGYRGSLVIAGPEPYYGRSTLHDAAVRAALDGSVRERVIDVGRVDEATKWWLLEHADIVLYPSIVEGFGLVPFEAAAVGTPCLAYAGSALAEVLRGTEAIVPNWNVAEWAERAADLIASQEAAANKLRDVRRVAAGLTWDATAARTWQAIDAILQRPHAYRFAEEGGLAGRVSGRPTAVAAGARAVHFANRVRSYAARRLRR